MVKQLYPRVEINLKYLTENVATVVKKCSEKGITGKRITPFLLDRVKQLTDGESLEANIKLVLNNANIGSQIAVELSKLGE